MADTEGYASGPCFRSGSARRDDGVPSESVQSTETVDDEEGEEGEVVTVLWSSQAPSTGGHWPFGRGKKREKEETMEGLATFSLRW